MTLKAVYDSLDEIPEALRQYYNEHKGKYEIKVEGVVPAKMLEDKEKALTKERTENNNVKAKLTTYTELLGNRDLAEVKNLLEKADTTPPPAPKTITNDNLDEVISARISAAVRPKEREIETLLTQIKEKETRLNEISAEYQKRLLTDTLREAATKLKILPSAIRDIINLAVLTKDVYVDEENNVVTKAGYTVEAWLEQLQDENPHWWPHTEGGNARGGSGSNASNNPFIKAVVNHTEVLAYIQKYGLETTRTACKNAGKDPIKYKALLGL